jgi:hypothetical protein
LYFLRARFFANKAERKFLRPGVTARRLAVSNKVIAGKGDREKREVLDDGESRQPYTLRLNKINVCAV